MQFNFIATQQLVDSYQELQESITVFSLRYLSKLNGRLFKNVQTGKILKVERLWVPAFSNLFGELCIQLKDVNYSRKWKRLFSYKEDLCFSTFIKMIEEQTLIEVKDE